MDEGLGVQAEGVDVRDLQGAAWISVTWGVSAAACLDNTGGLYGSFPCSRS
jgi:hypothetical protein